MNVNKICGFWNYGGNGVFNYFDFNYPVLLRKY
ncbi:hypothetical protein R80B4_03203 [Fibrobacteres bacterium R8-0-B4]